jgi:hypothetical protein
MGVHEGIARGYPMQSYRAEEYSRLSLLSFLTHYLLYLELQPCDDLCITSYCDNFSLLKTRKHFTLEVLTHQVGTQIMTLSALRSKLPIRLASLHVRAHQDENWKVELLPRPEQLIVLVDGLATEVLEDLRAADKPIEFYSLPACCTYLRDGTGYITSRGTSTLTNEFPEYEIERTSKKRNNWTDHIYDSINWTAYQCPNLCDQTQP